MTPTPILRPGDRVALVACSDGLTARDEPELSRLRSALAVLGLEVAESPLLFDAFDVAGRAAVLEGFFRDAGIAAIFDVSGGDLAGAVLTHLDLDVVARHPTPLFGYSDLTTIANGIHARTGQVTHLWTVRNLVRLDAEAQVARFRASVLGGAGDLFDLRARLVQGNGMAGALVGGNLRCLLKLAGTVHFPAMRGRVLALESLGATASGLYAGLHHLRQLGVLDDVAGILLGTFSSLQRDVGEDAPARIARDVAGPRVPVAISRDFGHGADSRAVRLGAHWDSGTHSLGV
ncbi:MAG: LD-carboxypeptidase [Actinomycetota bacterium]